MHCRLYILLTANAKIHTSQPRTQEIQNVVVGLQQAQAEQADCLIYPYGATKRWVGGGGDGGGAGVYSTSYASRKA